MSVLQSREKTSLEDEILEFIKTHPGWNAEEVANHENFEHIDRFLVVHAARFLISESWVDVGGVGPDHHDALFWREQV